jgi:hypothetical protein
MEHSNNNYAKDSKGNLTSEGLHLLNINKMTTKVNFRSHKDMMHSFDERVKRKKAIKKGANKNFSNTTYKVI